MDWSPYFWPVFSIWDGIQPRTKIELMDFTYIYKPAPCKALGMAKQAPQTGPAWGSKEACVYLFSLGVVTWNETLVLLSLYTSYVILCAMFGKLMDMCCPAYGKSNQIGFADMAAATTSFDNQDKTNRPTIDGFEAYKKNRALQNQRTMVRRRSPFTMNLHGNGTHSHTNGAAGLAPACWRHSARRGRPSHGRRSNLHGPL